MNKILLTLVAIFVTPVFAEYGIYNDVELTGLSRYSWDYNRPGPMNSMVCNVNGRDGFLSIRTGPGTQYGVSRKLERLAIVVVDTRYREGNWVYVNTAYRTHTKEGRRLSQIKNLHVEGWAHDGYLCDFLD